ncbi:hypothetical protein DAEQUDRAFT_434195 [Daedalea quercina L-15889]|uniref:Uncharacterized protein n=1 Tax=Daedalea quercina L-15889 TaxID=1314783 RepID=A0A165NH57_9APHY|nr:hypothetical protein DAEQUDRAFT_434195 [Daedalea quercina L-15889]
MTFSWTCGYNMAFGMLQTYKMYVPASRIVYSDRYSHVAFDIHPFPAFSRCPRFLRLRSLSLPSWNTASDRCNMASPSFVMLDRHRFGLLDAPIGNVPARTIVSLKRKLPSCRSYPSWNNPRVQARPVMHTMFQYVLQTTESISYFRVSSSAMRLNLPLCHGHYEKVSCDIQSSW